MISGSPTTTAWTALWDAATHHRTVLLRDGRHVTMDYADQGKGLIWFYSDGVRQSAPYTEAVDTVAPAERSCRGKIRHETKTDAKRARRQMRLQGEAAPGELEAYRCPHCGYWHLGHPTYPRGGS